MAIIAYSAGVGPSKPSSYDVSAVVSFAAVVERRNSQIRRSNMLRAVSAMHGKRQRKWRF